MRLEIVPVVGALIAGCAARGPSDEPPRAASNDGTRVATTTPPARCAGLRAAGRPAPSFDELRALLGRSREDSEVVALRARLGVATVGNDAHGGIAEEYREAGVTWSFLDRAHLSSISLDGRVGASARYAQPLPRGLAFTMSKDDVEPILPASQKCALGLPCEQPYPQEGLALTYEGGNDCLGRIELFTPLPPDELRIEAMSTRATTTKGETGAVVSFLVRRGRSDARSVEGQLALETAGGAPVESRRSLDGVRPSKLAITQRQDHRGPLSTVAFVVPYRDVKLPAGEHDLVARVAVTDIGSSRTERGTPLPCRRVPSG